ncbi:hypothetical protein OBBRIDRAFT_760445 [Obba rivulosa]|uniref:Uncharacterized protein n=1 Tax=Obba rivulosa TaxID=1052685 RepID=A0A8E2DHE0_9APHY|nr:hypothetical protein OBBRIDRAFT_760445 [Obba rivulosa]
MAASLPETQRAVCFHPPAYDIRVESVPIPRIVHPDDAIVKINLAGLCGSDLHIYRGHEGVSEVAICGHELVGEVVALGASFSADAIDRPELYSTLKIGDKVVSPFTVSCGECQFCRLGATCRCVHSTLFGIPVLPGGQAQYARIPKAGGTLYSLSSLQSHSYSGRTIDISSITDSSLILLADILPTGVFAALQVLQHPKLSPMLTGTPYPSSSFLPYSHAPLKAQASTPLQSSDRLLSIAVIGLGPVGVCATVALLDMLASLAKDRGLRFQVIAIDLVESRRRKMEAVYATIDKDGKGSGQFRVATVDEGVDLVREWTGGTGCNAIVEVVGNASALRLAYQLVRPFGVISSVGVHQEPPIPFTGREVYDKNVSFDFGRCPVRATFPLALDILLKRQDVFGGAGKEADLIDRVVRLDDAPEWYRVFDKGECGKVLFDPWLR